MFKFYKKVIVFLCLILTLGLLSACGDKNKVPDDVQKVKDKVTKIAKDNAKKLDGELGDIHRGILKEYDSKIDEAAYSKIQNKLVEIRKDTGSKYVYLMAPTKDGKPNLDGDTSKNGTFAITIDGSKVPDKWGTSYGWEIQFLEAWDGEPAAARSAWSDNEEGTELCWSAFAPVHDSDGNVVAIIGIDYPANEILDFPEWNRDDPDWNKIEE